jgi:hypothetical protein
MNGSREFPVRQGAAALLGEDLPCPELRVRALAAGAELREGAVGLLLRLWLVLSLFGDIRPGAAQVPLVRESDQDGLLQLVEHAPDPLDPLVVARAGQRPGYPHMAGAPPQDRRRSTRPGWPWAARPRPARRPAWQRAWRRPWAEITEILCGC